MRGRTGWGVAVGCLVQWLILAPLRPWGVCPPLLPGLVYLIGGEEGPERGALWGLLSGGFLFLVGGGIGEILPLTLLGGLAGEVVYRRGSRESKWILAPLLLALGEGLSLAGRLVTQGQGALLQGGREWFLSLLLLPVGGGLRWLFRERRGRGKGKNRV